MGKQTTKMLGTADVAKLTGLSVSHVRRLLIEGKIKGTKINNWTWLVRRSAVDRFLAKREK